MSEFSLGFQSKCKGSKGKDSSRNPNYDCICPEGYFDDYPYNLEC